MIFIYESIISFALFFVSFLSLSSSPAVSWSPSINFILAAQRSPPSAFGEKTELYNIYPRKQSIKLMSGTGDGMVSVSTTAKTVDADEKKVKVLGVGGGIGSGKSTACKLLVSEMSCLGHVGKMLLASYELQTCTQKDQFLMLPSRIFNQTPILLPTQSTAQAARRFVISHRSLVQISL